MPSRVCQLLDETFPATENSPLRPELVKWAQQNSNYFEGTLLERDYHRDDKVVLLAGKPILEMYVVTLLKFLQKVQCVEGLHLPGILFIADFVQEGFTSETDRKAHLYFHHECEALKLAPKMSSLGKMTAVLQEVQSHLGQLGHMLFTTRPEDLRTEEHELVKLQEERESAGSYLAYGLDLDELTMLFNNLIIMEQNPKATDREGNPLVSYADVRKIDMGGQQALLMLPADDLQEFNRATQGYFADAEVEEEEEEDDSADDSADDSTDDSDGDNTKNGDDGDGDDDPKANGSDSSSEDDGGGNDQQGHAAVFSRQTAAKRSGATSARVRSVMEAAQAALGRAGSSAQGAGPSSQRAGPSSQGAGPSSQAAPVLATVNEENALPSDDEDE